MARAGFAIDDEIAIAIDRKLPFMGYTTRQSQKHVIVVSGFAAESSMLEGLLAHELSHVYRNITNHPSHNEEIITTLAGSFIKDHKLTTDYQHEVLHQVINHVQDLYADDISIKVLTSSENRILDPTQLGGFFVEWVKDEPVKTGDMLKDQWVNAAIMLNNCFALSNMQRHNIPDYDQKGKSKNDAFLGRIIPDAAKKFSLFNNFMVGLREQIGEDEFQREMEEYLEGFFEIVLSSEVSVTSEQRGYN
jgi:hypothetical protein